ncbi:hypothetical protein ACHAW6_002241 [Cyclotella cf. meneghiniana]
MWPTTDFVHCRSLIIIIITRFLHRRRIQLLILITVIAYTTILSPTLLSSLGPRGDHPHVNLSTLQHKSRDVCSQHKQQVYSPFTSRNRTKDCNNNYCVIIVVTVNSGFYDFFMNWHRHFERAVLQSPRQVGDAVNSNPKGNQTIDLTRLPFLMVIAEDNEIYDKLLSLPLSKEHDNIAIILGTHATREYSTSEAADYDSPNYKSLVSYRATHLLNLVCSLPEGDRFMKFESSLDEWNKWIVIYSDIDTVWLKNPIPIIQSSLFEFANTSEILSPLPQSLWPKYDILASVDDRNYSNFDTYYCTGFLVIACTSSSVVFLARWENELRLNPQLNQPIFNSLLQTQHSDYTQPRHGQLSEVEFPPGRLFFDRDKTRMEVREQTVVVHNNYIVGHDSKKKRFEEYGLWLL